MCKRRVLDENRKPFVKLMHRWQKTKGLLPRQQRTLLKTVSEWLANKKERYEAKRKEHGEHNEERSADYHKTMKTNQQRENTCLQ